MLVKGRVYIRIQQTTTVTCFVNKVVFNTAKPTVYISTIAALELQFAHMSTHNRDVWPRKSDNLL